MSQDYEQIPLKLIHPEVNLPVDVFVFLSGKYLKYIAAGGAFSLDQFNKFISKHVSTVYVQKKDHATFQVWLNRERDAMIEKDAQKVGGKYKPLAEANAQLRELTFEVFAGETLNLDMVTKLKTQAEDLAKILTQDPRAAIALKKLNSYGQFIGLHSINVANLSVLFGMGLGHSHPLVLQNLYLGGLFHDYGKTKIDPKYWEKMASSPGSAPTYSQAVQIHPAEGAKTLQASGKFPDQVVTIVAQHHELFSGAGYPRGLKGKEIYELSRIVAIANAYDHALCEMPAGVKLDEKEREERALKLLEYDRGKQFDPELTVKIIEIIKASQEEIGP